MNKTKNLGLVLYEAADKFNITSSKNSLNHNIELIDEAIGVNICNTSTLGIVEQFKYLEGSGNIGDTNISTWYVITCDVQPNMPYHIKASGYRNYCLYAIYDCEGNVIDREQAAIGQDKYRGIEKMIVMPTNATSIKVAYINDKTKGKSLGKGHIWLGYPIMKHLGKKWVCIGDSLTERNTSTDLIYHDYIASELGLTVVNLGQGGTGYKERYDEGYAFYQKVTSVPTDADVVTIMGSCNDYSYIATDLGTASDTGTDTLCGCINTTIDTLISRFTTAGKVLRLGIITMPPTRYSKESPTNYDAYNNAIIEICKAKGIPCLDLYRCSNLHPEIVEHRALTFSKDSLDGSGNIAGVHPDETGHLIISSKIKQFIEALL